MKKVAYKIARVLLGLTILVVSLFVPRQVSLAQEDLRNGKCECVTYIVYALFGKRLAGNWPDAKSMANPDYWSEANMKANGLSPKLARVNSKNAKTGSVIIFQGDASYKVLVDRYDNQTKRLVQKYEQQNSAGYGYGHIGLVLEARYSKADNGWYITMQSANWPDTWGRYTLSYFGARTFYDPQQGIDFLCKNVSNMQKIFVPSGAKISFWNYKNLP